jgi:hypothetical protein
MGRLIGELGVETKNEVPVDMGNCTIAIMKFRSLGAFYRSGANHSGQGFYHARVGGAQGPML